MTIRRIPAHAVEKIRHKRTGKELDDKKKKKVKNMQTKLNLMQM